MQTSIITNLNSLLDSSYMLRATEADDITIQSRKDTQKAIGKQSLPNDSTRSSDTNEIDPNSVNDILGTKGKKSSNTDSDSDSDEDADDTSDDENTSDSDSDNDESDSDTDSSDDDLDSDSSSNSDNISNSGDSPQLTPEQIQEQKQKLDLYGNMTYFYNIICSNIDNLLSAPIDSTETSKVIQTVIRHLTSCKDILYDTLCTEFKSSPYVALQKKYVSLKQVYDICTRLMDNHVKQLEANTKKKKINSQNKTS